MCSAFSEVVAARRKAAARDKNRNKEYLFGVISPDDVEWAKNALDDSVQVKRYTAREVDQDRVSTVESETVPALDGLSDECVQTKHTSIKDLIENVQQLSLKLGAEGRQRESLEQQVEQLREQNRQLMSQMEASESNAEAANAYAAALEAIKALDVKDFGQNCEQIMDAIYSVICDAFGPDNNLALLFEEMADIYLKAESKHELEIQAMQKQIDFLTQFENVIKGEVKPNAKTLDSLVEQLKATKEESAAEITALRKQVEYLKSENQRLQKQKKALEQGFETEKQELNVVVRGHQDRYNQMLQDQAQLLSQLPLLKLTPTDRPAEDGVLRQSGTNTLEALVSALYRKDSETQKLVKRKDDVIQQQQSTINKLEARLKEWEADAILWLDYVNQSSAKKKGMLKEN
ncbi:leucine-rich repeat, putative [Babesia ovata]|uniref:Leucine-rich repeat, putative n=1 Tax=Babesia ovata TaxID=189622 RepID=A0A2H6K888_9APIC|nr:leucine-rich repeat, putative [Babesia ovata]GBE59213.1 leucine-rich repeat, putative [Babesia ovata]